MQRLAAAVLTAALAVSVPGPAAAQEKPAARRGFAVMARSLAALTTNRVYCGLSAWGEVCIDSTNSSTRGGGYWPRGTPDQYVFASGPQVAAIIGPDGGPWADDTTGAFFYDSKGTTYHGSELVPIHRSDDPSDVAAWPEAAFVPATGPSAGLFDQALHGSRAIADTDLWWVMWEGSFDRLAGRPHPLGVVIEARAMAFRYPAGADDQVYLLYTLYNASATDPAAYLGVRPEMRGILADAAAALHRSASDRLGVMLPAAGWTMHDLFLGFERDMDVADAGENYSSVALPLGLGFSWEHTFYGPSQVVNLGWQFPPEIFGPPFFPGPGLGGSLTFDQSGTPSITVYTNYGNGLLPTPQQVMQLFRYLSGRMSPAAGDEPCGYNPEMDQICWINDVSAGSRRDMQSWAGVTLAPGESRSYLAVFNFAAPVAVNGFTGAPTADIKPGDPRRWNDPAQLALGANQVDSIAGFAGWVDDNGNGQVEGLEVRTVPGSFYWKAQVAQVLFGAGFLRAQPPAAPEFFLVPGDNRVTVLWRPSPTEEVGDPYWEVAATPRTADGFPNPLYDANYRRNDVEGYRIWRGRTDKPGALELVAQFDHDHTTFADHYGIVDAEVTCAPELGVTTRCPAPFEPSVPGEPLTISAGFALDHALVQVPAAGGHTPRALLPDGTAYVFEADTLRTSEPLGDTGVPFVFEDTGVRNGLRYFYAVTAFDVNSIRSGPATMESARVPRAVTVAAPGTDRHAVSVALGEPRLVGRGMPLDHTAPDATIDPVTGAFSGPAPPSNAWDLHLVDLVTDLLSGHGTVTVQLDSIELGSPYQNVPHEYWFTAVEADARFVVPVLQQVEIGIRDGHDTFDAVAVDPELAAAYGGGAGFFLPADLTLRMDGADYMGLYGRGCLSGRAGFTGSPGCAFNGSRWFDGPSPATNETFADPNGGNGSNNGADPMIDPNNAGQLTGVLTIHNTQAYQQASGAGTRPWEGIKAGAHRAADFNVYWGAGGLVDSVIDITHNVVVPFNDSTAGGTWGILNASATGTASYDQRTELTNTDMGCVEPFYHYITGVACAEAEPYILSQTAVPAPVVTPLGRAGAQTLYRTAAAQPNNGFVMYISGDIFTFELASGAVPAAGTVWSLRQYIGAIRGGHNFDASIDYGDYVFTPSAVRALTAVGASVVGTYDVTHDPSTVTTRSLAAVHTVPDPYYLGSMADPAGGTPELRFVNLPSEAIVRVYSLGGKLVRVLEHHGAVSSDAIAWDLTNREGHRVAPGVYFWHVESGEARRTGRFTILDYRTAPVQ